MGRELKRVPLDFDWPLSDTWPGFLNPYYGLNSGCAACDKSGYSPEARRFHDQWYGNAPFDPSQTGSTPLTVEHPTVRRFAERNMAHSPDFYGTGEVALPREASRLCEYWNGQWAHHPSVEDVAAMLAGNCLHDLTHTWSRKTGWQPKDPAPEITPAIVQEFAILSSFGISSGSYVCVKAKCERLGLPHLCSQCEGSGEHWKCNAAKALCEAWEKTEPPTGEAYQIWETVSEGSPVSPPFATPEELASWMVANDNSVTRDTGYEGWLRFINGPSWAPSMVSDGSKLLSGVAAVSTHDTRSS